MPAPPKQKYPALRTIASVYRILAYIALIGGFIGVIVGIALLGQSGSYSIEYTGGIMVIVLSVLGGVVGYVSFLAASEMILVFIDMETNTRGSNILLRTILQRE